MSSIASGTTERTSELPKMPRPLRLNGPVSSPTASSEAHSGSAYLENRIALDHLANVMFGSLKRRWCELRNGRPGNRFQARFERSKRSKTGKFCLRQCLPVFAGAGLVIAGVILCFIPGPGVPLILLGAGLLAERSRAVAQALDWVEVGLRKMKSRGMAWWRRTSIPARSAVLLVAAVAIAGAGYGAFHIVFRD